MATLAVEHIQKILTIRSKLLVLGFGAMFLAACQTQEAIPADPETEANPPIITNARQISQKPRAKIAADVAGNPMDADKDMANQYSDLWDRIRDGFQLQAEYSHPGVKRQIKKHSANQKLFDLISLRATPFLFHIVEEIEKRGLPLELALLPIVESTYNPNAYSTDHAVGLWQMIGPTATSFGVQQDWWFDGRRDPLVSTKAALDYLEVLYGNFGNNWLVAIGAYNTGGGNMRRAMRHGDQTYEDLDFWSLPVALETQSLVPKLLAFAAIINDIDNHEIDLPVIDNKSALEAVELPGQIDLAQAAMLLNMEYDDLRSLNPGYLQWATHPDGPQILMVPPTKADDFRHQIAAMDPASLITWDRYRIESGDTLSGIASKLGTRTDVLMTINDLQSSRIVVGDSLLIPRNIHSVNDLANYDLAALAIVPPLSTVPTRYAIRSGDNLWSIARKFDLKSVEIAKWNNFAVAATLRPGQILDLSFARDDVDLEAEEPELASNEIGLHRVSRGDTIEKIAKRYQHGVSELLKWNNLSKAELIFPGQEIRLTPPDAGIN
jgi:membrane-bound lytic murein transglycosylase D